MVLVAAQRDAIESLILRAEERGEQCSFLKGTVTRRHRFVLEDGQEIHFLGTSLGASMRGQEFSTTDVAVFGFSPPSHLPHRERCRETETATYAVFCLESGILCLIRIKAVSAGTVIFRLTEHFCSYRATIT